MTAKEQLASMVGEENADKWVNLVNEMVVAEAEEKEIVQADV